MLRGRWKQYREDVENEVAMLDCTSKTSARCQLCCRTRTEATVPSWAVQQQLQQLRIPALPPRKLAASRWQERRRCTASQPFRVLLP